MANFVKGLFGAPKAQSTSDDDFADFAAAPNPKPIAVVPKISTTANAHGALPTGSPGTPVVYTKWYRVWERSQLSDFYSEMVILPFMAIVIIMHYWGRKKNKTKAKAWIAAHAPGLRKEYASVGFGNLTAAEDLDDKELQVWAAAIESPAVDLPKDVIKETSGMEYITYATGRQNVAFTDAKLTLLKRYNPATLVVEYVMSVLLDSVKTPVETMDFTTYTFDGKERELVPTKTSEQKEAVEQQTKGKSSSYDGFVWAVVNKESMKFLRDKRYDLSLTATREHPKIPAWLVIMSENAAITDALLSPELISALESAGDIFDHLIITDQPVDKPTTLNDTIPRKRIILSLRLPPGLDSRAYKPIMPLYNYFLHLPDHLVSVAHFRPEVLRKVRSVREDEQKKITKASDEEVADERRKESEKKKKEVREQKMRGMSAEEQRKFLEKERERETKKGEKKMSRKA